MVIYKHITGFADAVHLEVHENGTVWRYLADGTIKEAPFGIEECEHNVKKGSWVKENYELSGTRKNRYQIIMDED